MVQQVWAIAQKTKLLMLLWTAEWFMSGIMTEEDYQMAGVSHPVTETQRCATLVFSPPQRNM